MSTALSADVRTLAVRILTPVGSVFEGDVRMIVAPSVGGEVGIMPRHAPLIAQLRTGDVRLKIDDETTVVFATTEGYLSVETDHVLIMVAQAEDVDQIDRARSEAGLAAAEEALANAGEDSAVRIAAENRIRRNTNRLRVIEKYGAK